MEKEYKFYGWPQCERLELNAPQLPQVHTPADLYDAFWQVWCADTCAPRLRKNWSIENPTLGQCSITAFIIQDLYGGEVRAIETPFGTHCYNVIDSIPFDLTCEQFGNAASSLRYQPDKDAIQERESAAHFQKEEKRARYERLKQDLLQHAHS